MNIILPKDIPFIIVFTMVVESVVTSLQNLP